MDHFHVAARRDFSRYGSPSFGGIIGCDNPDFEGAASCGCRPSRLYPNKVCLSHALNMARSPASANPPSSRRWIVTAAN